MLLEFLGEKFFIICKLIVQIGRSIDPSSSYWRLGQEVKVK